MGGAPQPLWELAPPLSEVRAALAALLAGRILVGHHLAKDLKALGLSHPAEATRDTLQYRCAAQAVVCGRGRRLQRWRAWGACLAGKPAPWPVAAAANAAPHLHPLAAARSELQSRKSAGRGRRLRDLAAEKLGRTIQRSGVRHSPRRAHDGGGGAAGRAGCSAPAWDMASSGRWLPPPARAHH